MCPGRRGRRPHRLCAAERHRDLRGKRGEQPRGGGVGERPGGDPDVAQQVAELDDHLVDRRAIVPSGDDVEHDPTSGPVDGGDRLLQRGHGGAGGGGEQGTQVVARRQLGQPGEELSGVVGGFARADGDELGAQARAQLEDPAVGVADDHHTQLWAERQTADVEDLDPVRQQRVDQVGQHRGAHPARPPGLDVGHGGDAEPIESSPAPRATSTRATGSSGWTVDWRRAIRFTTCYPSRDGRALRGKAKAAPVQRTHRRRVRRVRQSPDERARPWS